MILEHDAIFTRRFETSSTTDDIGAYSNRNDPRGATSPSKRLPNKLQEGFNEVPMGNKRSDSRYAQDTVLM